MILPSFSPLSLHFPPTAPFCRLSRPLYPGARPSGPWPIWSSYRTPALRCQHWTEVSFSFWWPGRVCAEVADMAAAKSPSSELREELRDRGPLSAFWCIPDTPCMPYMAYIECLGIGMMRTPFPPLPSIQLAPTQLPPNASRWSQVGEPRCEARELASLSGRRSMAQQACEYTIIH